MTIYHLLVIFFTSFIPDIPIHVLYQLSFSPQATTTLTTSFTAMGLLWSVFLVFIILILDVLFLYLLITEFNPKWLSMKSIIIGETILLSISMLIPYLRDVFLFLSINTVIITLTYKIIKYENVVTGTNIFKYIAITGSYIYIAKLILWLPYTFIIYVYS